MNYFSNINTYLSYAVTRLTTSNYNEIDALVFSRLSYYPFEQIVSDFERCQISVPEFAHFVCGVIQTPPEEKKILFQVICSFIKNLIRQGKEWIAQHWPKGYNKSNVIQATI